MSVNCSNIGLDYNSDDFCLPITLTLDTEDFSVNKSWIAGAFFLGLFVGAGLTGLCVRPFLVSWKKKKVCIFFPVYRIHFSRLEIVSLLARVHVTFMSLK